MDRDPGRFFFALLSLARFSVQTGILDRPLVAGFLIYLVTGEMFPAMYVAVFFELLWIDIIPAGTFIPPNAVFCVVATMCLVEIFGLHSPAHIFPAMVLAVPAAFVCSWLEGVQRTSQNKNYNIILQQSRKNHLRYHPEVMIRTSLSRLFLIYAAVGVMGIYILTLVFGLALDHLEFKNFLPWEVLLLVASVSALAGLRIKKAYVSLVLGMVCIAGVLTWKIMSG
ncbi:MAG: PTS sugar transporter subunit IIC [Desulfonatronovibrionaceae bacterium]